jgi:serine/threonine protein kinase
MATVTKAWDLVEQKLCAIKRLKPGGHEMQAKESFHRELKALSDLGQHPNIVTCVTAGQEDGEDYLVLEWVPFNLEDWIKHNGAMSWPEYFSQIGRPMIQAVAFAQNRGWLHRDIKPLNILITDNGSPKISDYGIARQSERPRLGMTLAGFQSAPFTPPEADDGGIYSAGRDCFSLAAVTLFALTGKKPQNYGEQEALLRQLDPSSANEVLAGALSNEPSERCICCCILATCIGGR